MEKRPYHYYSLSRRIVLQFCFFTLFLSLAYSFISFTMMYTLEDSFIEKEIYQEAQYLSTEYQKSATWPSPRTSNMTLHFSKQTFPEDIRQQAIEEPNRREFYGEEERHYHLVKIKGYTDTYLVAEVSKQLYVRPIRSGIISFLTVSALVVTAIACMLAWLIGRRTTRPLKQLAEQVAGVAPEQIPAKFAHHYPNNEVGALAHMLEQTLQRMAQALEREKCFTRDASHELRTPLAVIKNAAELYKEKTTKTAQELEIINRIAEAAEQMDKTVHTLLMLAREEHSDTAKQNIELMPVIEQSILDHHKLLQGKDVHVIIDDSSNTKVCVQVGMLKVLLDNVISNAFQYIRSGEVKISFEQQRLIIRDTGPGIESTISDRLTEPAVKGSQSTSFGFGLSIVKRLCQHQGWQLEVTSDHGTKVSVRLID